jgi:hypothetical protein
MFTRPNSAADFFLLHADTYFSRMLMEFSKGLLANLLKMENKKLIIDVLIFPLRWNV